MTSLPLPHEDVVDNLGLAVIASSYAPLLLLDGALNVVATSTSFCRAFGIDPARVVGCPLATLGDGEWNLPQLRSLLVATVAGQAEIEAYEIDLRRKGHGVRNLVLNAHKLEYGDQAAVRLLVSVLDVTDARVSAKRKEDLLHEKAILLQELQHRVANSLQIIASVLMQSARRVQSEETRKHLHDAHLRVMSVAAMQKQLAISRQGDVALRAYFNDLCRSIGTSMIQDPKHIKLTSTTDGSVTSADASMSMGLIVTELVINALKHAFPTQRSGHIDVNYMAHGSGWTLSVRDDGIGLPGASETLKSGLGTNIIDALAKQLDATVTRFDAKPGTQVTIAHTSRPGIGHAP